MPHKNGDTQKQSAEDVIPFDEDAAEDDGRLSSSTTLSAPLDRSHSASAARAAATGAEASPPLTTKRLAAKLAVASPGPDAIATAPASSRSTTTRPTWRFWVRKRSARAVSAIGKTVLEPSHLTTAWANAAITATRSWPSASTTICARSIG